MHRRFLWTPAVGSQLRWRRGSRAGVAFVSTASANRIARHLPKSFIGERVERLSRRLRTRLNWPEGKTQ